MMMIVLVTEWMLAGYRITMRFEKAHSQTKTIRGREGYAKTFPKVFFLLISCTPLLTIQKKQRHRCEHYFFHNGFQNQNLLHSHWFLSLNHHIHKENASEEVVFYEKKTRTGKQQASMYVYMYILCDPRFSFTHLI